MQFAKRTSLFFIFAMILGLSQLMSVDASAQSNFFSSRGCTSCHSTPVATSCNACHHHGNSNLRAATDKGTYAPGEAVNATLNGGSRSGWISAILYNENGTQVSRSNGNASGMGGSTTFPATLTSSAPMTPGTYTWAMAYYGNQDGSGHAEVRVNTNSFTVASPADTVAPVVSSFTLPSTSTNLSVQVTSFTATDNVAVTGYQITTSSSAPTSGWLNSAASSVTAVEGSNTFYAWAIDAAGNISVSSSDSVTVTLTAADTTGPVLNISALDNGTYTNNETLNISGNASDVSGLQSVSINGQAVTVAADGSFSLAVSLAAGANTITTLATDTLGNQTSDSRIVNLDLAAPVLDVTVPADNSTATSPLVTLSGTISESAQVSASVNGGSLQSAAVSGGVFSLDLVLEVGVNTIDISATDLAGNITSAKRTVTVEVGTMTLSLAVTSPNQDITTNEPTLEFRGQVVDAIGVVTIQIQMEGQTYTPNVEDDGTFEQTLNFSEEKQYAITVIATDEAGNSGQVLRNVIYQLQSQDVEDDDDGDHDRDHDRDNDRNHDRDHGDRHSRSSNHDDRHDD